MYCQTLTYRVKRSLSCHHSFHTRYGYGLYLTACTFIKPPAFYRRRRGASRVARSLLLLLLLSRKVVDHIERGVCNHGQAQHVRHSVRRGAAALPTRKAAVQARRAADTDAALKFV